MRLSFIIIFILLFPFSKVAQTNFELSGYVVDLPIYQPAKEISLFDLDEQYFNLTRARLKPTFYLGDYSRLNVEYEINALYLSESNFGIFELTSTSSRRQIIDMNWNIVEENNFMLSHFIDRLSFRQEFNVGNIEIGRQRIAWGSGRIWNPTDLFNPINPANFSKIEKDGADAISSMIYMGNFTDLNLVFNPNKKIGKSNYGFRFRTNYNQYDLAVIGGYFDERPVAGLDIAGNLFDAGVRGEGIISFKSENSQDTYLRFILGIDYQFTPELYSLIEYQYNGEGKTDEHQYELFRLVEGEILNLNKNYLASSINYKITPLLISNIINITNLNDGSGYFGISFNYSVTADIYVIFGSQIAFGGDFDEYSYYPDAFYFQGEFYF